MKKILAIALCLIMVLSVVACGTKEADYKLGLGVVVSTASSKEGNAQVDATIATVVTDAEGKIVVCRIDCAQSKMAVVGGAVEADKTFKTKMELGDDYGMVAYGAAMAEWDAQTKEFEKYVVGKTAAEVKAIQTQEAGGHQIAVDEALLKAGCSMQITDFITAVAKAGEDKFAVTFKTAEDFTLGVGAKSTAAESTAATADTDGSAKMYTDFGAAVVAGGKILAALTDATKAVKMTLSA